MCEAPLPTGATRSVGAATRGKVKDSRDCPDKVTVWGIGPHGDEMEVLPGQKTWERGSEKVGRKTGAEKMGGRWGRGRARTGTRRPRRPRVLLVCVGSPGAALPVPLLARLEFAGH
uniref:Uncharacterized protein n=1 Tax=Knipowitschia caucasica TaxID=637954 RepID=A0AAV2MTG5_KNICA